MLYASFCLLLSEAESTTGNTHCHGEFELLLERLLCDEIQVGHSPIRSGGKSLVDADQSKSPCVSCDSDVNIGFNWQSNIHSSCSCGSSEDSSSLSISCDTLCSA